MPMGFQCATLAASALIVLMAGLPGQTQYLVPETPLPYLTGGNWTGMATGDLNGDGRDDFVMTNALTIYAYLTTSSGNIAPPVTTTYFGVPAGGVDIYAPVLADFNLDGILDVVVYNGLQGQQRVFFGNGNGTFTWVQDLPVLPLNGIQHRVVDLDNDGRPEVLVWSGPLPPIGRALNIFQFVPQTNSFLQSSVLTLPLEPPWFGDFNGDGNLDLIGLSTMSPLNTVLIYLGDGALGFSGPIAINYTLPPYQSNTNVHFKIQDVDLDGMPDIVLNSYPSLFTLPWNTPSITVGTNLLGTPTWTTRPSPGIESRASWNNALHVVDINGDGFPDIVGTQTGNLGSWQFPVDKTRLGVMLGDGTGAFSAPMVQEISGNTQITNSAMIDLDLDGDPDFVGLDYPLFDFTIFRNMSRFGP
ncbi:MAG TPA: VCBS repeat-containing protein, partial [Planctomycetota bacterium]|nr:VCBS repeat-containing protein [Planctomycetota bacterium]